MPDPSGAFITAGTDDEPQAGLIEGGEVRRREHAGIRGDHHRGIGQVMTLAKAVMIGTRVVVSAVLPSKQPIAKGNPVRSTSRPTTICGSMRRSLE